MAFGYRYSVPWYRLGPFRHGSCDLYQPNGNSVCTEGRCCAHAQDPLSAVAGRLRSFLQASGAPMGLMPDQIDVAIEVLNRYRRSSPKSLPDVERTSSSV